MPIEKYPGSMVEIISVSIESNYTDSIESVELEGFVRLFDNMADIDGGIEMFNPDIEDTIIFPNFNLLHLVGPPNCVRCDNDVWSIHLDLTDKRRNVNLCHGAFGFSLTCAHVYANKPISFLVSGEDGHAIVHSIFYTRAVQAAVKVHVVDGVGDRAMYGHIRAYSSKLASDCEYDKLFFRSTLFYASQEKPKKLLEGGFLLLSRDKVAVPLDSDLCLDICLTDASTKDVVFNGTLELAVDECGSVAKKCDRIEVSATFDIAPPQMERKRMEPSDFQIIGNKRTLGVEQHESREGTLCLPSQ